MQNVLEEVFDLKIQVKDMKLTLEEIMAKLNFLIDEIQDRERKHKREIIEMRKTHDRWMDDMVQEFDDFKSSFATRDEYGDDKKKDLKNWTSRSLTADDSSLSIRRLTKQEPSRSLSPPLPPRQRSPPPIQRRSSPPIQRRSSPPIQRRTSPPRRSSPPPPRRSSPPIQRRTSPPPQRRSSPPPPRRSSPPLQRRSSPPPPRRSSPPLQRRSPSPPAPPFVGGGGHPKTDVSKLRCYRCHDLGHMARNCTNKAILCYKCKKFEGHVAENCPYGDDERGSSPDMGGPYGNNEPAGKFDDYDRFDGRRGGPKRYAPYRPGNSYHGKRSRFDDE